jgi:NAD(P)-dependent dehydrogenase (short-subunit alcohol dehydrogenase family)
VITGASSGIGHAAARRFAIRGSRLVLAARGAGPLENLGRECKAAGADVLTVPTDVSEESSVENLARQAVERHGRIDVWVNGAAVMSYGKFVELPSEVFRQVIETNLMGQVHGARAALKYFRDQGRGVLINMSSVWGRVTTPQVTPYSVSKHAVRVFSECLRHELDDQPEIRVATMLPQAVDTPIFEHAANYSGNRIRPIPPILDPDEIAQGIEACAENPKTEVTWGRSGRLLEMIYAFFPRLYCRIAPVVFMRGSPHRIAGAAERGKRLRSGPPAPKLWRVANPPTPDPPPGSLSFAGRCGRRRLRRSSNFACIAPSVPDLGPGRSRPARSARITAVCSDHRVPLRCLSPRSASPPPCFDPMKRIRSQRSRACSSTVRPVESMKLAHRCHDSGVGIFLRS